MFVENMGKITKFQIKRREIERKTFRIDIDILEKFGDLSAKSNQSQMYLFEEALKYSLKNLEVIDFQNDDYKAQNKRRETESVVFRVDKDIFMSFIDLSEKTGLSCNNLIERALIYALTKLEFIES